MSQAQGRRDAGTKGRSTPNRARKEAAGSGRRPRRTSEPARLSTKPRSSTKRQHQTLVIVGHRRGMDLAEVRKLVGGSLTALSAAKASHWIEHLSGQPLPNPPGQKPSAYEGKRKTPGATRMITEDQVEQIGRIGLDRFGTGVAFCDWLSRDFKVRVDAEMTVSDVVRQLGTAKRAGEVIRVLKLIRERRRDVGT